MRCYIYNKNNTNIKYVYIIFILYFFVSRAHGYIDDDNQPGYNQPIITQQEIKKVETDFIFSKSRDQTAFYDFLKNIRCVTCQNQTLAESNAPVAETMRVEIYNLWLQNKSMDDIRKVLSDRYGEFVLYEPHFSLKTAILWIGPFLFLLWGIIILRKNII